MTESIIVHDISELEKYQTMIKNNLEAGIENLKKIIEENTALEIFKMLKFEKVSVEPLNGEKENIIEVINQSMTYIVSLMAVEYLLNLFPQKAFKINWGNIAGYDIESLDEEIICECFAATSYKSNAKLTADLKRLEKNDTAIKKFEFFYDKEFTDSHCKYYEEKYIGVKIVKFKEIALL